MNIPDEFPSYEKDNETDYNENDTFPGDSTDFQWPVHPTPSGHYEISAIYSIAIAMYVIVFALGVPGNGLVVWVTTFEMKKTVNSVWFLNLAVADLLCCLSVPFSVMTMALGYWPMGLFACKAIYSMLLLNMFASVLILTVISIDRCALVLKPVWCQNKRTTRKAQVACLVIWCLAFLMSSPSFIFRNIKQGKHGSICSYNYGSAGGHKEKVENSIAIFRLLMGFVIPFVGITGCYSVLMRHVSVRFTQSNKQNKSLKVILIVVIGFFACWLPYHVAGLILSTESSTSPLFKSTLMVDPILIAIAFLNSCINPIIYVLVGREFKSKFKRSIKSIMKNALSEEVSQTIDSKRTKSTIESRNMDTIV
ncbi:C5a anaphylatoxin chemotactic receptor 1-like [Hyperolius riggenbachi]|uniref:C5a anaphylatoxin chemotactic receptor 1-like n=1 Tax=Hyperolius riggenbachi TaxID=752182 RepID=UPI0035A26B4A